MTESDGSIHLRLSAQDDILREQTKALASIDSNVKYLRKDLLGNGQPGRLQIVEENIKDLEAHKNRALGWIAGAGAFIAAALAIFEYFQHTK
jgi:uncharacterized protein with ACT and thioredoxin-like domain